MKSGIFSVIQSPTWVSVLASLAAKSRPLELRPKTQCAGHIAAVTTFVRASEFFLPGPSLVLGSCQGSSPSSADLGRSLCGYSRRQMLREGMGKVS